MNWVDRIEATLERLEVADTLEELRHNIDDLIRRLSDSDRDLGSSDRPGPKSDAKAPPLRRRHDDETRQSEGSQDSILEDQISSLGSKVDGASDLLAQLSDLLDSQSERIETIEQQIGEPDLEPDLSVEDSGVLPAGQRDSLGAPTVPAVDQLDVVRVVLERRVGRIEQAFSKLEQHIAHLQRENSHREREARDLEERLLILVDSALEPDEPVVSEPISSMPITESATDAPTITRMGANRDLPELPTELTEELPTTEYVRPQASSSGAQQRTTVRDVRTAEAGDVGDVMEPKERAGGGGLDGINTEQLAQLLRETGTPTDVARAAPSMERVSRQDLSEQLGGEERLSDLVEREVRSQQDYHPTPRVAEPAEAERFGRSDAVAPRRGRPTVMVVDDVPDSRTVLSIYLSKTGYQVVTAASAEDCLSKLRYHDVDAVILDASMPGGTGAHVCQVLRQDPAYARHADLAVIVYTGYPAEFSPALVREWGATDYVVKGGDMLPLITALVRHTDPGVGSYR